MTYMVAIYRLPYASPSSFKEIWKLVYPRLPVPVSLISDLYSVFSDDRSDKLAVLGLNDDNEYEICLLNDDGTEEGRVEIESSDLPTTFFRIR